jgi:hypothetical protein
MTTAPWPRPDGPFPQEFGRYRLVACLGKGGMGAVFRAQDSRLDKEVALKVPDPDLLARGDLQVLERFRREARAAARFEHPNLCQVYDLAEHEGVPYLTMRYVKGGRLVDAPPADVRGVVLLVHKLALALAEVHRLGVVHRDLKLSNVLLDEKGEPVITDFGLALRLDRDDDPLTQTGNVVGTGPYMAPEQHELRSEDLGPACDVYQLGVILFRLLTGQLPFRGATGSELQRRVLHEAPPRPSQVRPGLEPRLDAVCTTCLAKRPEDRYPDMHALAAALAEVLGPQAVTEAVSRPRVPREALRFAFVGQGSRAPEMKGPQDRLFLDVGNDLRAGVLDHHHLTAHAGSTAGLVLAHPRLIDAAVKTQRQPDDPFTLVLHAQPDLDCLCAAYLAAAHLSAGSFPPGADALALYVDRIDEGGPGLTLANPFSLYAGYMRLTHRLMQQQWSAPAEQWQERLRLGFRLLDHVLAAVQAGASLAEVDALACPEVFDATDRREVQEDVARYDAKLADPRCKARRLTLRLPGTLGGTREVEALLARDVQNVYDPERCAFFKDWARTDEQRSASGEGFPVLSVFMSEGPGQSRRCILSVTPDCGASLRGLGRLLDEAESERRKAIHGGEDDRVIDPITGERKRPRPGYNNADPWYDGRAHYHTIVDSPHSGTVLSADEIEGIFCRFGQAKEEPRTLA